MKAQSYAQIEALDSEALWPGRIPFSEPTFLVGSGGVGKGLMVADIIARVTTGRAMPDGSQSDMPPGNVVTVMPEDDQSTSVAWRLRAAHADLERVYDATEGFSLPDSLPALRELIDEIGDVRLVVIDPLSAVSSVALASGPVKIRSITNALETFAADTGVALLIVHHLTKDGKVSGSKVWTDAARVVLGVTRSKTRGSVRELGVVKSNVSSDAAVSAYTITGNNDHDVHVEWCQDDAPDDVPRESASERVLGVLEETGEPMSGQELATALRLSYGTVRVALHRLASSGEVWSPARGLYAMPTEEPALAAVK